MTRLGAADLQVHTRAGDGTASAEEVVRWARERPDLDLIAVTDHDDVRGGLEAQEVAARLAAGPLVIPGIEVTTRAGHLLALFPRALERPPDVPPLRSLAWTIAAIHDQAGVCLVPHPLALVPLSVGRRSLDRVVCGDPHARPDGIELANPAPPARWRAAAARRHNRRRWHLAETGGSDAHFLEAIGSAVTRFPGRTPDDLCRALAAGNTVAELRGGPSLRAIGARRILRQQTRGMAATPRALLARARQRVAPAGSDGAS